MDSGTSYFTFLASLLAAETIVLAPFLLYSLVFPTQLRSLTFAPPNGDSKDRQTKVVKVAERPYFGDYVYLIMFLILDTIFLYPFTRNGLAMFSEHPILCAVGTLVLSAHAVMALGWSTIKPSWMAAEKNLGLWNMPAWSSYYLAFILTGVSIGIPLACQGIYLVVRLLTEVMPTIWKALCSAYAPLSIWAWALDRLKSDKI
jgi:hypothetical protein